MRRVRRGLGLIAVVLIMLAAVARPTSLTGAQSGTPAASGPALAATWVLALRPSGAAAPSYELVTFTAEGGLVVTSPTPGATVGQGAWERAGDGRITATIIRFRTGADGQVAGADLLWLTMTLGSGGDRLDGSFVAEAVDAAGKAQGAASGGTVQGNRLTVGAFGSPPAVSSQGAEGTPTSPPAIIGGGE